MRYLAAGIGKVHIGSCRKVGSTSLQFLCDSNESVTLKTFGYDSLSPHGYTNSFRDNIFVLLLRDVEERWKSGTITDCPYPAEEYVNYTYTRWGEQKHYVGKLDEDGAVWLDDDFLSDIVKHHSVTSDLSWMWNDLHTKFWEWNAPQHNTEPLGISLLEFSKFENIYFLELKDLSNPKFLKWLQERDSEWECIEEIPHKNPSANIVEPDPILILVAVATPTVRFPLVTSKSDVVKMPVILAFLAINSSLKKPEPFTYNVVLEAPTAPTSAVYLGFVVPIPTKFK